MSSHRYLLISLLLFSFLFCSCSKSEMNNKEDNEIQEITITNEILDIAINEEFILEMEIEPSDVECDFRWESSDESVAIVSDGVVTGVSEGSCVISVQSGDIESTCEVIVHPWDVSIYDAVNPEFFADVFETYTVADSYSDKLSMQQASFNRGILDFAFVHSDIYNNDPIYPDSDYVNASHIKLADSTSLSPDNITYFVDSTLFVFDDVDSAQEYFLSFYDDLYEDDPDHCFRYYDECEYGYIVENNATMYYSCTVFKESVIVIFTGRDWLIDSASYVEGIDEVNQILDSLNLSKPEDYVTDAVIDNDESEEVNEGDYINSDYVDYIDVYWSEWMYLDTGDAIGVSDLSTLPLDCFYNITFMTLCIDFSEDIPVVPNCYYVIYQDENEIKRSDVEEPFFYFDRYEYQTEMAYGDWSPIVSGNYSVLVYSEADELICRKTCYVASSVDDYYSHSSTTSDTNAGNTSYDYDVPSGYSYLLESDGNNSMNISDVYSVIALDNNNYLSTTFEVYCFTHDHGGNEDEYTSTYSRYETLSEGNITVSRYSNEYGYLLMVFSEYDYSIGGYRISYIALAFPSERTFLTYYPIGDWSNISAANTNVYYVDDDLIEDDYDSWETYPIETVDSSTNDDIDYESPATTETTVQTTVYSPSDFYVEWYVDYSYSGTGTDIYCSNVDNLHVYLKHNSLGLDYDDSSITYIVSCNGQTIVSGNGYDATWYVNMMDDSLTTYDSMVYQCMCEGDYIITYYQDGSEIYQSTAHVTVE